VEDGSSRAQTPDSTSLDIFTLSGFISIRLDVRTMAGKRVTTDLGADIRGRFSFDPLRHRRR
jgi:hypothetical protein